MFSLLLYFCLGWITGTALQLQQPALWLAEINQIGFYASLLALATFTLQRHRLILATWVQCVFVCVVACVGGFFYPATRAQSFLENQISPQLEGQVIEVTGRITAMPQKMQENIRFRFAVQSATLASGEQAKLPPLVLLGWYANVQDASPSPMNAQAGDMWRFSVKLKAPHGHINPHGFDYELWLWEQGIQATGYVRHGVHDTTPTLLSRSWQYPLERSRQFVRERVYEGVGNQDGEHDANHCNSAILAR